MKLPCRGSIAKVAHGVGSVGLPPVYMVRLQGDHVNFRETFPDAHA